MKQFILTQFNNQSFAVELDLVKEINKTKFVSSVPMAPEYIVGLEDIRGQIVTILNIGFIINEHIELNEKEGSYYMILNNDLIDTNLTKSNEEPIGIIVNSIHEVISIEDNLIQEPPGNLSDIDKNFIQSVINLKDNLIMVLNLQNILNAPFQTINT